MQGARRPERFAAEKRREFEKTRYCTRQRAASEWGYPGGIRKIQEPRPFELKW
jgi:hypothetical protein